MQSSTKKSIRILNRLFNIRADEWPRVLLLFLISALTNAGAIWGITIAYAAFLQQEQAGVRALPWILVLSSVLSIVAIAVYTAFVDRIADDRLLIITFAIGAACITLGLMLVWLDLPSMAYPLLYLLALSLIAVINPHQNTYFNSFYDTQAAKRVLPVISAGYRAGAIVAGLTMPLLNRWLDPGEIIVLWLLVDIGVMGLIWLTSYVLKENITQPDRPDYTLPVAATSPEKQHPSYIENMREGFQYTAQSTYLRWMATGTLLLMVLKALLEYRSSELLLEAYGTVDKLANFMGLLAGVGNLVVLPMLLFGMSRLIARLGLGHSSLIFPGGSLVICGFLIYSPGLASASAAYLNRSALRLAFQAPIDGLLYNAVPLRIKGRVRAFVSGLIVPVGSLIGGLLLFLPFAPTAWFVPTLIGVLAVAYMISALVIGKLYGQALIKMLEQEDFSFLLSSGDSNLVAADPATLNFLQKKLKEGSSHEFTIFMAQLISQLGGSEVVKILGQTARVTTEGRVRAAIIDVLAAAGTGGQAARQLYIDFLADSDGQVRQAAIAGLEQLAGPKDEQFLSLVPGMLSDPDIDVRVRVLSALARSGNFYDLASAVEGLNQLLADRDPHRRARGVRILGRIGDRRAVRSLVEYLADPEDEVRLAAAAAIEALSEEKIPHQVTVPVLAQMSRLLQDPVERVRQAALNVSGRLGSQKEHRAIVTALIDPSPQVRATAVDVLVQLGRPVIPILHLQLDSPNPQLRKMAAVILSRVSRREFGPLIESHIADNLRAIYGNYGRIEALSPCARYPSIPVLQSALREQSQQLIDEIFHLLTAIHDPKVIETVTESLQSENPRVRANAIEALETLITPKIAQFIAPWFETNTVPTRLLRLGKDTWGLQHPDPAGAIKQLLTDPDAPWLRALITFALGEIGAALAADGANIANTNHQKERETGHPRPAGQPGALAQAANGTASPQYGGTQTAAFLPALALAEGRATAFQPHQWTETPGRPSLADQAALTLPEIEAIGAGTAAFLLAFVLAEELPSSTDPVPFTLPEIEALLEISFADPNEDVRLAAQAARRLLAGQRRTNITAVEEILLSTIEKIIFLKEVPFFQSMTIHQLEVLAKVCEEELFEQDRQIFNQGDPGGALYVIVSGRVGIEHEKGEGPCIRLATLGAHSYFGEITLFDRSPRSASAIALQDTLTLRLRREPLIVLARQYPEVSLELIQALSEQLRKVYDGRVELIRTRPGALHTPQNTPG